MPATKTTSGLSASAQSIVVAPRYVPAAAVANKASANEAAAAARVIELKLSIYASLTFLSQLLIAVHMCVIALCVIHREWPNWIFLAAFNQLPVGGR